MVSLTTIFRISAEATEEKTRTAARPKRIRGIETLFMSRQFRTRIFLLLFVNRGRHFFGLAGAGVPGSVLAPSGKTGAAGDKARAPLVSEIRPSPLDEDENTVAEANQEKNVDEQPGQPGYESRDVNL